MPSTNTITAFYVFSAGTKARSAQVTNNFGAFRGHWVPVDPSLSAAAVTKSYDLGSADHRWGNGYFQNLDLSITTTAAMIVVGLSASGMSFQKNGVEIFSVKDAGFSGINRTQCDPTATTGPARHNVGVCPSILDLTLTASGAIAGSTITVTGCGRPMLVGLLAGPGVTYSYLEFGAVTAGGSVSNFTFSLSILQDGVALPPFTGRTFDRTIKYPPSSVFWVGAVSSGTHTFALSVVSLSAQAFLLLKKVQLIAFEL